MNEFNCRSCGYEFKQEFRKGKYVTTHGDKPPFRISFPHSDVTTYDGICCNVSLYACPACKTVKADW